MESMLDAGEVRVLGSLMEKELATPEYYPLSLNALINACNQKTNRSPVLVLEASDVEIALQSLKKKNFVYQSDASRVPKYWQDFVKQKNLISAEAALLCLLLLRGPQTAGELRSRAENLSPFESLEQVALSLENLSTTGLVARLPRQPGQKEQRFIHLLAGDPVMTEQAVVPQEWVRKDGGAEDRLAELELSIASLQEEMTLLKDALSALRKKLDEYCS